jgi:hypothetical protein
MCDGKLSKLDDAMRKHIAYLVLKEGRPFPYADLLEFEVNGFQYRMAPGTARNKLSAMVKTGEIEVAYYSSVAFYTLKDVKFTKRMTADHPGGPLSSICTNQDLRISCGKFLTRAQYI